MKMSTADHDDGRTIGVLAVAHEDRIGADTRAALESIAASAASALPRV